MSLSSQYFRAIVLPLVVTARLLSGPGSVAQQTSVKLSFDVASVRPSKETEPDSNVPLGPGNVYSPTHGILRARNFPVLNYLVFAYKLADYQQDALELSLPDWALTDRYSIEAKTEKSDVTKDELRLMMRSLLEERFHLAVHYDTRSVRVFALRLSKTGTLGPKLRQHPDTTPCADLHLTKAAEDGKTVDLPIQGETGGYPVVCNGIVALPASAQDRYSFGASDVSMKLIASSLSSWGNLGRPVVDKTGLQSIYDFVLEFTPDPRPSYATIDSGGPGFQEALKQQLGLILQSDRALVEFLLIDHVQRPDAN
jgi:uncharacterized protein (TIGR03435 family)